MKRILFLGIVLCTWFLASAQQKKIETFNKNTWRWIEEADQYQSVAIEDGYMVISNLKAYKKGTPYQNMAKTFAKLPLRPNDNFKMTIKYIVPEFFVTPYFIYFNTDKKCLQDDEGTGEFSTYLLYFAGQTWGLNLGNYGHYSKTLPGKFKQKKDVPMEIIFEKKFQKLLIEINGIEIFNDECPINSPCFGFGVLRIGKKTVSLKIDEIIIEQDSEEE